MKTLFIFLGIMGALIISILSFILPTDPFLIIPAMTPMTFDKPLWLCGVVGGNTIYLGSLYYVYDKMVLEREWCL